MEVLKAWDYDQTIFHSEKLQIAYIKAEKIPGNIFVDISKVRKSSRRGLLGRQTCIFLARKASRRGLLGGSSCILSQKVVPQGAFGQNIS